MFAFLYGKIDGIQADSFTIDVGGLGFELNASTKTLARLQKGQEAKVLTHLHLAEGVVALYGFAEEQERSMFRRLISISRVGPKLALAALSSLKASEIATAILCEDDSMLSRVPGLGKKTAQRIILELREKMAQEAEFSTLSGEGDADPIPGGQGMQREAVAALVALGYDASTAARAVHAAGEAADVQKLITQALKTLARA